MFGFLLLLAALPKFVYAAKPTDDDEYSDDYDDYSEEMADNWEDVLAKTQKESCKEEKVCTDPDADGKSNL